MPWLGLEWAKCLGFHLWLAPSLSPESSELLLFRPCSEPLLAPVLRHRGLGGRRGSWGEGPLVWCCRSSAETRWAYDQPRQHIKSRDVTLPTQVCIVKAVVFPVVMHGCDSWTIKKAEHRRIDAFELRCWRRLLRVRWTARRSNQIGRAHV